MTTQPTPVILESPFNGFDQAYTRLCMTHSMLRNEAPFASHMLYTQVLDDDAPFERELGLACGFSWITLASMSVAYVDYGISDGMLRGIKTALNYGKHIHFRAILKPHEKVHNTAKKKLHPFKQVLLDLQSSPFRHQIVLDYLPKET